MTLHLAIKMDSKRGDAIKTIAVISQKGGAGKTTLVINLAGAAEAAGLSAVIIDLDPQASAKVWHDHRKKETPVVISAQSKRLTEVIATAKEHGADLCIIDTAPHSETAALDAAKAADIVLIPCRASYIDLKAVSTTVDIVNLAKSPPAMFVLSCVRPGDRSLPDDAEKALSEHGLPICPIRISLRSDCVHALTAGQTISEYAPDGAAAKEVHQLFKLSFHQDRKMTNIPDKKMTIHHDDREPLRV